MRILVGFLILCLLGCATPPPRVEYTLARAAIQSAREAQAPRYSPGFWTKAGEFFRTAEEDFRENRFDSAKKLFLLAISYAEKAENISRIKKFKSGDEDL